MKEVINIVVAGLGAIGGWEALRYIINRKSNKRIEEAKADGSEFSVLKDTNIFLQQQRRHGLPS